MKELIKPYSSYIVSSIIFVIVLFVGMYFIVPQLGLDTEPETKVIKEYKVLNNYKESYQSIYGTYYKYYLVTEDGTSVVSDTEYYESVNTGVYRKWKTSN